MQYLLSQLAELNIKLKVMDGQLHVNAPVGTMTAEVRSLLRQHKQELIDLISNSVSTAKYEPLPTITPDPDHRYELFPLTAIQHAYWMGRSQKKIELGGVSTHLYFESQAVDLDLDRFEAVLNQLIKRHDMLRVVINSEGEQRALLEIPPYKIQVYDVRDRSETEIDNKILEVREKMSHQVLPTGQAPIMEVRATRVNDNVTRLHFSLDMLVLDAWSMMLLFREWKTLYDKPLTVLPSLAISYRDYALAEEKLVETEMYCQAQEYWWSVIDQLPAAPQIPLRNQTMIGVPPKFSRRRFRMNAHRWKILQQRAKEIGVTPTGIVLAAFTEVLTLWSSSSHYTLNVTLFNRQPLHPDVNKLLGDFTSLMLLEVDHREGNTFQDRAIMTQMRFMKDLQHRAISGLEVMRELRRRRAAMMEAAMPVVFTGGLVYSGEGDDAGLLESFGPMLYGVSQTPQVSLDHQVMEVNGDLVCNWDCVDDKFAPGMLDDLYNSFCTLMEQLVDSVEVWAKSSVVSLPKAQAVLRSEVNNTDVDEPRQETLHGLFIKQALQHPEAPAVITYDGKTICYGSLLVTANRLAGVLLRCGVSANQRIAVIMHKGWEQVVAVLGILISGGAYLPINASFPEKRRNLLLEQGGARIVITQSTIKKELSLPDDVMCFSVDRIYEGDYLDEAPVVRNKNSDLAYVLFTSGTTGIPKGVMIEHRNVVNTVYYVNQVLGVKRSDRILAISALNFDLSVYDLFGILGNGGCLVMPNAKQVSDPAHWYSLIGQYGVTLWNSAPALMGMLVDYVESLDLPDQKKFRELRMVWMSGDRIPVPLPERVTNCFPSSRVISLGGPTETSIWSIYYPINKVNPEWVSIPYGKPLPNQKIYVLNEQLQHCPAGVVGMIYIGGAGIGRGYLGDEEKTNKAFIHHPDTDERLYDSGDLGRFMENGCVEIVGRSDFQIKIRGYRIELGEIASTLTQHPEIKQAVVMPSEMASGEKQIVAYVVPEASLTELGEVKAGSSGEAVLLTSLAEALSGQNFKLVDELQSASWDLLTECYLDTVKYAFSKISARNREQESISLTEFSEWGVQDTYLPWCRRAMNILVTKNHAKWVDDSTIEIIREWSIPAIDEVSERIYSALSPLGFEAVDAKWMTRASSDIIAILQGSVNLEDVYYFGDSTLAFSKKNASDLQQKVASIIGEIATSEDEELVVLEVGAGLGALTTQLAPALEKHVTSYLVTDVRESNLEYLHDNLADRFEGIEFGLYDLNEDPEIQGLYKNYYDVIIASLVLHEVDDADKTLTYLNSLLRPGGVLLIAEPREYTPSYDLYLGLAKGFNRACEKANQLHCLKSNSEWIDMVKESGFSNAVVIDGKNSLTDLQGISLIVAQSPHEIALDNYAVKQYLSSLLPDYMVPHHIVQLDAFPMSVNGKIDYKALPMVNSLDSIGQVQIIQPRNDIEQHIHSVWMSILAVPQVGVTTDFFDVGGDSLLAAKVVREINQRLPDFNLEVFEFFEHLSIEALAALYDDRDPCDADRIRSVEDVATSLKYDPSLILADVKLAMSELVEMKIHARKDAKFAEVLFVTGATGWLGAYVVHELLEKTSADIYCLVRAEDEIAGLQRISDNLMQYNLALNTDCLARIKPVPGDLAQRNLGMSEDRWIYMVNNVDAIYHIAASVSIASSYPEMRAANVGSVVELARMAIDGLAKPFYFCSSVAVLINYDGHEFSIHKDETGVASPEGLIVGYAQSKWVAETILLELSNRGLPVKIFRIAHVLPDTTTYCAKPNYIFESVLSVAEAAGVVPDWEEGKFYGIPVDIAGRLLVDATICRDGYSGIVHMDNRDLADFRSLIHMMLEVKKGKEGKSFEVVSFDEWLKICREVRSELSIEMQSVLNFLLEPTSAGTMLEALYATEPSEMSYLDGMLGCEGSLVSNLTPPEYWLGYFRKTA